tara:strand:+ start:7900 stop:8256 length:357 start_codon:yes stop_codon:yes gene_type:complete
MKNDRDTHVSELKEAIGAFIDARNWSQYHSPKNLAMSIAIEAAEMMEHFQWTTVEEARTAMEDPEVRAEVREELADVMIYCLSFARHTGIDVSGAVLDKLEKNEHRFPVDRIKGFGVE